MMRLTQLGPADFERVMNLWQRADLSFKSAGRDSKDAFIRQLASGVQTVLAFEEGDELIGVVVASHDSRKGWINRLAVDPAWQHQGIGTRLIEAAESHLREQGIEVIAALIFETNLKSIAAFRKVGYVSEAGILYFSKRPSQEA